MTDRELLERAARAAGYVLTWKTGHCKGGEFSGAFISGKDDAWNPLTDDGDALRLAVKLSIYIQPFTDTQTPSVFANSMKKIGKEQCFPFGDYPYSATRRAIVRAAAAMAPEEAE